MLIFFFQDNIHIILVLLKLVNVYIKNIILESDRNFFEKKNIINYTCLLKIKFYKSVKKLSRGLRNITPIKHRFGFFNLFFQPNIS